MFLSGLTRPGAKSKARSGQPLRDAISALLTCSPAQIIIACTKSRFSRTAQRWSNCHKQQISSLQEPRNIRCVLACPFTEKAFIKACQYGTAPSYRARINIIGQSGAGKTSLTRRLLGQKFQETEESTDGIETHRIEFPRMADNKAKETWTEAELRIDDLVKEFSQEVVLQVQKSSAAATGGAPAPDQTALKQSPTASEGSQPVPHSGEHTEEEHTFEKKPTIMEELKAFQEEQKKVQATDEEAEGITKGVLRLWDFGGQTEFYATHHMFLDADAVNIIVMDISKALRSEANPDEDEDEAILGVPSTPEEFLCYWLRSIEAKAEEKKTEPTVLVVLTHKDLVHSPQPNDFVAAFKKDIPVQPR